MAWIVATRGTSHNAFSVSPAQAASQSWLWTTSGRQSPSCAANCVDLVVRRGHAGDDVVVGDPRQVGAGSQHPNAVDHRVVAGVGVVQR